MIFKAKLTPQAPAPAPQAAPMPRPTPLPTGGTISGPGFDNLGAPGNLA
jgi:hypothetical protein